MRAILTSVDYAQELAICLPYNRHHFSEVWVITSPADEQTQAVTREHGAKLHVTDAFYRSGAEFAKWAALEEALDAMGRFGWLCIMDADILWPEDLSFVELEKGQRYWRDFPGIWPETVLEIGKLYTPLRRVWAGFPSAYPKGWGRLNVPGIDIPDEDHWREFPLHRNVAEHAGYSQLFHASDPVLGSPPWHETDWRHAGGADSFFQAKWAPENKVRPPFEVLHLGPSGVNWAGRTSVRPDGTVPPGASERRERLRSLIRQRRPGPGRFDAEKL